MSRIQTSNAPDARPAPVARCALLMSGLLALSLPLGGCSDGATTGPGGNGGEAEGSVTFFVGNSGSASASIAPSAQASVSGARPPVDPSQILSFEILVEAIEAHRKGGSATTTPPWVSIPLNPSASIDPAALDAGEVEVMADADLPVGEYDMVRLIPESISVTFQTSSSTTPIVVGNHEFAPLVPHAAEIPGGLDKGILVPTAHFSVEPGVNQVTIMWDADATAASFNATGSGKILVRPVFK